MIENIIVGILLLGALLYLASKIVGYYRQLSGSKKPGAACSKGCGCDTAQTH